MNVYEINVNNHPHQKKKMFSWLIHIKYFKRLERFDKKKNRKKHYDKLRDFLHLASAKNSSEPVTDFTRPQKLLDMIWCQAASPRSGFSKRVFFFVAPVHPKR